MWVAGGLDSRLDGRYGLHKPDELCPYVRNVTESSYAYLLGLYLGDGCVSSGRGDVYKLFALEPWQRWIAVERNPELLLRGLIHSDGCRATNRVKGGRYSYVRYMFSNRSEDIRGIFTDGCGRTGIEWRQNYYWMISIARRSSVEKMDQFIGPKS